MSQQEEEETNELNQKIFNYLRDNLTIEVDVNEIGPNYEVDGHTEVVVNLYLINPATGKRERID